MTESLATERGGPLAGVRVLEFAGLGPTPFAAMLLADLGATVIRIERPGYRSPANQILPEGDPLCRSRTSIGIDLKSVHGKSDVLGLVGKADILLEGFRPGVMERLGLGPVACIDVNPKLVYGRMTGYGQTGPLARVAGHDINYIAVGGAAHYIGDAEKPVLPLNVVGDFGGGGMLMALGLVAATLSARRTGEGQVVDAAVIDGTNTLMSLFYGFDAADTWIGARGTNLLDGGCHYYNYYKCSDGDWLAVGAIEPAFYNAFIEGLGVGSDPEFRNGQAESADRERLKQRTTDILGSRPKEEWRGVFEGTDACVTPLLTRGEMATHPLVAGRRMVTEVGGITQPLPAPRFSQTTLPQPKAMRSDVSSVRTALRSWGIDHHRFQSWDTDREEKSNVE